ncbi:hypothetical protein MRAB57_2623 [Mycobacterium rhizamassiliense]|uniref:Uncharacterized protein n=2 Tax=Mycobacterium TaxID=1763 RepID=A0A2U3PA43_9MYCO|nr:MULTISPECIES: hypothetical protein [Mycobacterium]SPM34802.1 hypothetical protein MRAB57_2623 [Mycobacterium rhizamassiliense]SPM40629.1 hypothetical protein MNAB215_2830 [Mycobacterium numidiamassiliense]
MILRYDLQLQTMIKAMIDSVAPAVDPGNALAREQAQLVIGTLTLMAEQLPLQYRFDRDELTRAVAFADQLGAVLGDYPERVAGPVSALSGSAASGRALLSRSAADPTEIVTTARAIRTALDHLVDVVFTDDSARTYRDDVRRIVLDQSRGEILRDRVWSRAQGFDANAYHLPTIESLLAPTA